MRFASPLVGKTTDWRAGCGRSASPVRREGGAVPLPTPIVAARAADPERQTHPHHPSSPPGQVPHRVKAGGRLWQAQHGIVARSRRGAPPLRPPVMLVAYANPAAPRA